MTTRRERGSSTSTSRLLAGPLSWFCLFGFLCSLWPKPTSSHRDLTLSCVRHDSLMTVRAEAWARPCVALGEFEKCCSVLYCNVVCGSALQCVAVCYRVLQCVAYPPDCWVQFYKYNIHLLVEVGSCKFVGGVDPPAPPRPFGESSFLPLPLFFPPPQPSFLFPLLFLSFPSTISFFTSFLFVL